MTLDIYHSGDGSTVSTGWDHELIVDCFDRILGRPFEREALERDDCWVRYKVHSHDEIINANLILDYGNEDETGDWMATSRDGARYLAFTFACQLWLDYPTPLEIKTHVETGLVHLSAQLEKGENGLIEDTVAEGRRKIYFEREGVFDLRADPAAVEREAVAWAEMALADVAVAAQHIIYPDVD